ncbi:MAG: hypothetical protein AB1486_22325 [Planctomycetota bacterium]
MKTHESTHDPDSQFVTFLEWQIRTGLRRRATLGAVERCRLPRWIRSAALVLVSLFLGAAGIVAAEHVEQSRERELLLARTRIDHELAVALAEGARAQLQDMLALFENGRLGEAELATAKQEVREIQLRCQLLQLDLEEIEQTARPPRTDLAAPLIGGRDFVTERLQLQRTSAAGRLALSFETKADLERLAAFGRVSTSECEEARVEAIRAEQDLAVLDHKITWRARFHAGEVAAAVVDLLAKRDETVQQLEASRARVKALQESLARARALYEGGRMSSAELYRPEAALKQAEADVRRAEIEIALLDEQIAR